MSVVASKVADLQGVVEAMVDNDRCCAPLSGGDLRAIEQALARYQNGLEDVIDSVRSALQHVS